MGSRPDYPNSKLLLMDCIGQSRFNFVVNRVESPGCNEHQLWLRNSQGRKSSAMALHSTLAHPDDSLHSFTDTFGEKCDSQELTEDLHFSDSEWDFDCDSQELLEDLPFSNTERDLDCLVRDSPSTCLPSCAINCQCSSPLDFTPRALSYFPLPGEMLSTHVMHPKLVNTLKSFMTPPSPTFSDQCGRGGISGAASEERSNGGSCGISGASSEERSNGDSQRCDGKQVYSSMQQQQSTALTAVRTVPASPDDLPIPWLNLKSERAEAMVDDDEAAVVSVDWIQNRRPFNCVFAGCDKTFKNPQTMKMHHRTHYSEDSSYRPMDAHAHGLSLIRAGHNKKIPSRCPVCRKTFVGLYELRRHFGRKHTVGDKTFGCTKCSKKFYIEVDLRDHEKLCGDPIECKCGMKFAFKCNLVAHKKGHPDCQDPPSEEAQIKKGAHNSSRQQTQSSRSRNASPALAPATGKRNSPSSEEFPVVGFSSNDVTNFSSEGYHPTTTTNGEFTVPGFSSDDVMNFWSEWDYSTATTSSSWPLFFLPKGLIHQEMNYIFTN